MTRNGSKITDTLSVDPALEQDANYRFNEDDRQFIDNQTRGIQQHLVDELIRGHHASFLKVTPTSATLQVGMAVCLDSLDVGEPQVTKCTVSDLANAMLAFGVVIKPAAAGGWCCVCFGGALPRSVTGLGLDAPGFVRVNPSTALLERVVSFTPGDYGIGVVDPGGNMQVVPGLAVSGTGGPPTGLAGGDLGGTYPNPDVLKIHGVAVSGTPSSGQIIVASDGTHAAWATSAVADEGASIIVTSTTPGDIDVDNSGDRARTVVAQTSGGTMTLRGLKAPGAGRSRHVSIINDNADGASINVSHDNGVTSTNGFSFDDSSTYTIAGGERVQFIYDRVATRWKLFKGAVGAAGSNGTNGTNGTDGTDGTNGVEGPYIALTVGDARFTGTDLRLGSASDGLSGDRIRTLYAYTDDGNLTIGGLEPPAAGVSEHLTIISTADTGFPVLRNGTETPGYSIVTPSGSDWELATGAIVELVYHHTLTAWYAESWNDIAAASLPQVTNDEGAYKAILYNDAGFIEDTRDFQLDVGTDDVIRTLYLNAAGSTVGQFTITGFQPPTTGRSRHLTLVAQSGDDGGTSVYPILQSGLSDTEGYGIQTPNSGDWSLSSGAVVELVYNQGTWLVESWNSIADSTLPVQNGVVLNLGADATGTYDFQNFAAHPIMAAQVKSAKCLKIVSSTALAGDVDIYLPEFGGTTSEDADHLATFESHTWFVWVKLDTAGTHKINLKYPYTTLLGSDYVVLGPNDVDGIAKRFAVITADPDGIHMHGWSTDLYSVAKQVGASGDAS